MKIKMKHFALHTCCLGLVVLFLVTTGNDLQAQSKKKASASATQTASSANGDEALIKASSGEQVLKLKTKTIRVRIQSPRVSILMKRMNLDVGIDNDKLEGFGDEIKERPNLILFMKKTTEHPADVDEGDLMRKSRE